MYKLYYSPGACSMAVHVALLECGQTVTLEKVDLMKGEQKSPEYLKLNPRGQVPVLVEDGRVLREGAAILIHLLDTYKSPLLPREGAARDAAIEWLMFCNATLHPAYSRLFFLSRNVADPAAKAQVLEVALAMADKLWAEVEARLEGNAYLAGPQITIADILLAVIANWGDHLPRPLKIGPKAKKLLQTVVDRPAYKKALEVEQVTYRAAA